MTIRTRRTTSALALVLPHPPLPPPSASRTSLGRRSSYSSMSSIHSIPHTPSASGTPLSFKFDSSINGGGRRTRSSTDSWASSTHEADEMEWEWTKDHIALLSKRLDSIPQSTLTPFSGSVPPSNLLDRLARQVTNSQTALEWPHSVRATRQKLLEIARLRNGTGGDSNMSLALSIPEEEKENEVGEDKEDDTIGKAAGRRRISGEAGGAGESAKKGKSTRKPLYRQNSMDFLNELTGGARGSALRGNDTLSKLSSRLQRTTTRTRSHPYARPSSRSRTRSGAAAAGLRTRSPSPSPFHTQRRASTLSLSSSGTSSRSESMPPPATSPALAPLAPTTSEPNVTTTRKLRPRPLDVQKAGREKTGKLRVKSPKERAHAPTTSLLGSLPEEAPLALAAPIEEKKNPNLKRPPSHSAVALKMKGMKLASPPPSVPADVDTNKACVDDMDVCPLSSDEEEKARGIGAKKPKREGGRDLKDDKGNRVRTRTRSGGSTTATSGGEERKERDKGKAKAVPTPQSPTSPRRSRRAISSAPLVTAAQQVPLSPPPPVPAIPLEVTSPRLRPRATTGGMRHKARRSDGTGSEVFGALLPSSTAASTSTSVVAPQSPPIPQPTSPRPESPPKTLRRVNKTHFPLRPGRKISFGSLVPAEDEGAPSSGGTGEGLQAAFEMNIG